MEEEIEILLENCPTGISGRHLNERIKVMNTLHHKLGVYEVYGLMIMLELALWKARIETYDSEHVGDWRHHCRITSGAALIVPEVVSYLFCLRKRLIAIARRRQWKREHRTNFTN